MRNFIIAAFFAAATLVGFGATPASAGQKCITEECRIHLEAEIASLKHQVDTCVKVTQYDPAFLTAFAYRNGRIIWTTSWDAGTQTSVCLPRDVWEQADRFWVCKGRSLKLPKGKGKELVASHMNDWRRAGRALGVMNIKG